MSPSRSSYAATVVSARSHAYRYASVAVLGPVPSPTGTCPAAVPTPDRPLAVELAPRVDADRPREYALARRSPPIGRGASGSVMAPPRSERPLDGRILPRGPSRARRGVRALT